MPARASRAKKTALAALLAGAISIFANVNLGIGASAASIPAGSVNTPTVHNSRRTNPGPSCEPEPEPEPETCETTICKEYDDRLYSSLAMSINQTVDPCDDFYEFTCAGYLDMNPLEPGEPSRSPYDDLYGHTATVLMDILSSPYELYDPSLSPAEQQIDRDNFDMLKDAYNACKDLNALNAAGITPLKDLVDEFATFFPATGSAPTPAEIAGAMAWMAEKGLYPIIRATPRPDEKDTANKIVYLSAGTPGLAYPEYYLDSTILSVYKNSIKEMFGSIFGSTPAQIASYFGVSLAEAASLYDQIASDVSDFQAATIEKKMPQTQYQNVDLYYNKETLSAFDASFSAIDVSSLLQQLAPAGATMTNVIVMDPDYFSEIDAIVSSQSRQTMFSYFSWLLMYQWASRLHPTVGHPVRRISNAIAGFDLSSPRNPEAGCPSEIDAMLDWIISTYFVNRKFKPDAKAFGTEVLESVIDQVRLTLESVSWMSEDSRAVALTKLQNLLYFVGYPEDNPNVLLPSDMATYYGGLVINPTTHFQNSLSSAKVEKERTWDWLVAARRRDEWDHSPQLPDGQYYPTENKVIMPAAMLQPPVFVFDENLPEYISVAYPLFLIGHEVCHAFDSLGRRYNANGQAEEWWDAETVAEFESRAQCYIDQYNSYTVPGPNGSVISVNGLWGQGENIADAGGFEHGYRAWKARDTADPSRNPPLPKLSQHFTKDQIFFLHAASMLCTALTPEEELRLNLGWPHAPFKWRVNGAIMENNKYFREAFNCPALPNKQPTEPRCELWE